MKFLELNKDVKLIGALKEVADQPTLLWHCDKYDGILSGFCTYNEKPHYFKCFHEEYRSPRTRYFAIIEISNFEFEYSKFQHELFRDMVGWHSTYDENGKTYPMHPESSEFQKMSKEEIQRLFTNFYKGVAPIFSKVNLLKENNVVAFWCDTNKPKILIEELKKDIKTMVSVQKENKIKRKTNSNEFNGVCYYQGQKLRAYYIALHLLKGKSIKNIEKYNPHIVEDMKFNYKWIILVGNVTEICSKYSLVSDKDKWNKANIQKIFSELKEI